MNGFMRKRKRMLAGTMAVLMVLSTILSYDIVAFASSNKQTIAAWEQTSLEDYKTVPYNATTGNATLTVEGATPAEFSTEAGFTATEWNDDNAAWVIKASTLAYSQIEFSAKMQSSGTGPSAMQLQYSTDEGMTWNLVGDKITLTADQEKVYKRVSLKGAENQESLWIRIKKDGDTAVNGGQIKEAGACSIADIELIGESQTVTTNLLNTTEEATKNTTGTTEKTSDYEVETGVQLQIAKWAGNGNVDGATKVYADLDAENDYKDTASFVYLSNGNQLGISNTSTTTGGTTYSLGAKGLQQGDAYIIETSSEKYANMKLNFSMKGSGTAPKTFEASYSVDGTDYKKVDTITQTESGKYQTYSIAFPSGADNAKKLYIKLTAGGTSVSGGALGNESSNYIQTISIKANPIASDEVTNIVTVTPDAGEVAIGDALTMTSKTEGAAIYYSIDGTEFKRYEEANKPVLTSLPAVVTTYAQKEGKEDSLKVTYAYTQAQVATVKASPNGGAITKNTKITLTCATEEATILYSLDEGATWKEYNDEEKVTITDFEKKFQTKAVKTGCLDSVLISLQFTQRVNEEYGLYFGQLHSHTNLSDGAGDIEEAYEYASNEARKNIDFLAVTDHSNSFDKDKTASITDADGSEKWSHGQTAAQDATTDSFVGIYGYEMTWSNGLGHMNTFNTEGFQSRTQTQFSAYATGLQNYYAALKTVTSSISQFNHPGTSFGDFSDFAYYDEEIDQLINLVEVGNGEGSIGSNGYFPSYEYYTRALDKGWHVAPTISQDNHKGRWGDANTGRTVALADVLDRDNIYDALRNKRVYATEDDDLEIRYTLDGNVMGSELDKDAVGDKVRIEVALNDQTDEKIGTVQVIVNGGLVLDQKTVNSKNETVTFDVTSDYSYYYIKVIQADGNLAVTAPVWVGEVEAVGISSLKTETALAVQGQAVDVTLDMYNNEASDLEINEINFTVENEVVHAVNLQEAGMTKVESMGSNKYTFDFMHNSPGSVNLNVEVKATLNGVGKIYNGVLKLEYVVPAMVTNIVIDGTHGNDYVTGYYGGNMGNFAKLASTNNAQVNIVSDKITDETLKDCSLLVISAPARKNGTGNGGAYVVSHFEEDFLKTVKNYTDRGGELIVCGIADYQDSVNGQSSTEINKLLNYIGATITINSDQMQDTVNNGGQAYRLYLTDINKDSSLMEGTVEGQKYSAYSGCSVNITNATKDTATAKAAEWLVKGHSTTNSLNTKTETGASIPTSEQQEFVPKGEVVASARQQLAGGGNVIVAGTIFMSNFEVEAELDNIWDVPYVNRTMMENLLGTIKAELPISKIKDARNGNLKDVFRIQGRVTAGTSVEGNTFFDTIYIQDETGGITIFPYSTSGLKLGSLVEIIGYVDEYQGDKELQIMQSTILDETNLKEVAPTQLSAKDAMNYEVNGGKLIQVEGTVAEVEASGSSVGQFRVKDASGNIATVFIDGYIYSATTGKNTLAEFVKVGEQVSAVGLLYKHPEGDSEVSVPCLRVRNTDEIKKVQAASVSVGTVSNVKVSATTTSSISLSWNNVSGATGYRVGSYVNGKWSYTDVTGTTFKQSKLAAGTAVSYKVQAYTTVNGKTYYGKESSVLKTAVKPATTTVKAASQTKTTITLSWKSIKNVSGYTVSQLKDGKWVTLKDVSSKNTTYKAKGLKAGSTYKFRVRGYVMVNGKKVYGDNSAKLIAGTKPATPTIRRIKTSSKKVTITWKKVSGADGYVVYRYNTKKQKYETVATIKSGSKVSYTQSNLKRGTTYRYKVKAYSNAGSTKVYSDKSTNKHIKVK